jgi:dolichol-phosphate mannosyltransferase
MRAMIMIPTYNERGNIAALIEQVFSLPLRPQDSLCIVVVDDASPDGTADAVRSLQERYSRKLFLIERRHERGRGTAGIAGFEFSLEHDIDCIVEMDADFSHDPKYLPAFLAIGEHFDVVIGSRFVEGGKDARGSIHRSIITQLANLVYRTLLGLEIRDISGGYKCYQKHVLQSLSFSAFLSKGYPVGMETLFRCQRKGASFIEVPIRFQDRREGRSKFVLKEAIQSLVVATRLCWSHRILKNPMA